MNHPKGPFPNVFMDIVAGGKPMGRIIFKLYEDTPKTSENFRAMCTGEFGKHLHYKGCHINTLEYYLLKGGGDMIMNDGDDGSIYGKYFPDENFNHKHDRAYLLGMCNLGERDTN